MELFQLHQLTHTSGEGFTKKVFYKTANGMFFVLNFEPGQVLPAHTHAESELAVVVLEGRGQVTVDGRTQAIAPGTLVHCAGHESFSVQNVGASRLSLLAVLSPTPADPRFAKDARWS